MRAPSKVLVLGAGGFVGRRIVHALKEAELCVVAHLGPEGSGRPPAEVEGCETFFAALESGDGLRRRLCTVDTVVHAAGPPSVAASFDKPVSYAEAHVLGTARAIEAAVDSGCKRWVYVSSAEVYGRPRKNPVLESEPSQPLSPYAGMKVAAETMMRACARRAGIELIILRPFSIYGPDMSDYSLLGGLISQTLANAVVEISAPDVVRDYVFVDDVARAVVKSLICASRSEALVVNIGSGRGTSALELAFAVQSIAAIKKDVVRRSADRPAAFDIPHLVADIGSAKRELAWEPAVPLRAGLALTIRSRAGALA